MGFDPVKLKLQLKLVITRLQMLQKKRENMGLTDRRQIADLLKRKKDELARIKVEQVIRDDYLVEAMEILEMYCTLLSTRFGLIESVKHCDAGIQESVCTIIWASSILQGDVPELKQITQQLHYKYGKEISQPGYEETIVNAKVRHKLSIHQPPATLVEAYLVTIAEKYGVPYTPLTPAAPGKEQPDLPEGHLINLGPNPPSDFGPNGGGAGAGAGSGGSGSGGMLMPTSNGSGVVESLGNNSNGSFMQYNPAYPPQSAAFPQQPMQPQQSGGYPPSALYPPGNASSSAGIGGGSGGVYNPPGYSPSASMSFDPYPQKPGSASLDAELPLPPSSRPVAQPSAPSASAPAQGFAASAPPAMGDHAVDEFGFPMPPKSSATGVNELPVVPGSTSTGSSLNYDDLTERFNALRKR
eukprot:m.89251 g.89251  ORF g.89251 m.89251 type:complete len:412 (+) comp15217_c0_seq1:87-1322(+)